jgi:glycosyltransferase involved in cell wall biosynthesis
VLTRLRRVRHRVGRAPDISLAHDFRKPPYGGANQFFIALRKELRANGWRVDAYRIGSRTRACVLNSFAFDDGLVRMSRHEDCVVAHRVDGPVAAYRGADDGADGRVAALNSEFADVTILQSQYSLTAHAQLGIALRSPVVIPNAVDPLIFHPAPTRRRPRRPLRLIATSWSDNPNKGAETLEWLDRNLDWSGYECTFVGQTAGRFANIRIVPPLASRQLADVLRAHDVYLAPSRNDPCSNALIEALACGLPAVYLESGGHPELVGQAGLGYTEPLEIPALLERLSAEYDERREQIAVASIADVAELYLDALGLL